MRQNEVRRERRKPVKTLMKTMVKKAETLAESKKMTPEALSAAYKAIDTAAKKGIIHHRTASRRKSAIDRKSVV